MQSVLLNLSLFLVFGFGTTSVFAENLSYSLAPAIEVEGTEFIQLKDFGNLTRGFPTGFGDAETEHLPYYDRLFEDGRLDMTIVLGFMPEFDVVSRAAGATGDVGSDAKTFKRILESFEKKFKLCHNDYQVEDRQNSNEAVIRFQAGDIQVRVRLLHSSLLPEQRKGLSKEMMRAKQKAFSQAALGAFIEGRQTDDVNIYFGHAAHGRGPYFGPRRFFNLADDFHVGLRVIPVDLDFDEIFFGIPIPFTSGHALNRSIYNPDKYQIDVLLACDTDKYYKNLFLQKAYKYSGKTPSNLDLISYEGVIYDHGLEDTLSDFIGGLLRRSSRSQLTYILNRMETSSTNQYEAHFNAVLKGHRQWIDKVSLLQAKLKKSELLTVSERAELASELGLQAASIGVTLVPWLRISQPNPFIDDILKDHAAELLRSNPQEKLDSRALKLYRPVSYIGKVPQGFIENTRALRRRMPLVQRAELLLNEKVNAKVMPAVALKAETKPEGAKKPDGPKMNTDLSTAIQDVVEISEALIHAHRSFYHEIAVLRSSGRNSDKQHINTRGIFDDRE